MSSIFGFPNRKRENSLKHREERFLTVQPLNCGRGAADVLVKYLSTLSLVPLVVDVGSTPCTLISTAPHGAKEGDVVSFVSGNNYLEEHTVLAVIDAMTLELAGDTSADPIGDTFKIRRPTTPNIDSSGNLVVVLGSISTTMVDSGSLVDFTGTPVDNVTPFVVKTLTTPIVKMQVCQLGGGIFFLYVNGIQVGYITAGQDNIIEFAQAPGAIISIKSIAGTVNTGKLFFNYLG